MSAADGGGLARTHFHAFGLDHGVVLRAPVLGSVANDGALLVRVYERVVDAGLLGE
jgi:hypothetical protein